MRRVLVLLALATALSSATTAHAQSPEAAKAFEEGRRLRDQKDYPKAIAAFERSVAASPSIGAYYNLGVCHEAVGDLREAFDAYKTARDLARGKPDERDREKDIGESIAKLLDSHNHLVLVVGEELRRTEGFRVAVDGAEVPPRQYGGPVFRAPLLHDVVVTARGRRELRQKVRNKDTFTASLGEPEATGLPPSPPFPLPDTGGAGDGGGGWGWQHWTGLGLAAAGVGSAVVGVVFTAGYYSEQDRLVTEAEQTCVVRGEKRTCGEGYQRKIDDNTSSFAVKQGVAYGLGAVLIGAGIVLFVTAPSASSSKEQPAAARVRLAPRLGPSATGLDLVGSF